MKDDDRARESESGESSLTPIDEDAPRGVVRVHDDVFVSIASICACQIAGVARVGEAPANQLNIRKLVGLSDTKHGVRLKRSNGNVKEIAIFITVREGYALPAVAEEVQRSIKEAVDKMTGANLQQVNVYVEGIEFPSVEEGELVATGEEAAEG